MGAQKKKAKFVAKGLLSQKIKQRNAKKKFQAMKDKKRNRFERNSDAPSKKKLRAAAGEGGAPKKDEPDMLDEMDVDDFLNADFLDSDNEEEASDDEAEDAPTKPTKQQKDDDDVDDGSSSEEEDESALDPRYMTGTPFGGDDDDDDDEDGAQEKEQDEDEDAEADAEQEEEQQQQGAGRTVVTMAVLQKAEKECFEAKSVSGLRRLMKIFSDACRSSDAADSSKEGEISYDVQSSAVYNRLMVNVFRKTHETLTALVALESSAEDDGKFKIDDKKWKKYSLVIRRFFSCACYLLEQTTGQDIQTFVLHVAENAQGPAQALGQVAERQRLHAGFRSYPRHGSGCALPVPGALPQGHLRHVHAQHQVHERGDFAPPRAHGQLCRRALRP
ncbi:hypothetical protein ON010_g14478 [Phytophthora cinnamomi]|nr:hypothetical protein ON010_g14478 [Phytophthora cinnamomi]